MTILDDWQHMIEAVEDLEVDGPQLDVQCATREELQYALIALVLYSSRHDTTVHPWGYALSTDGENLLTVQKVSVPPPSGVVDAPPEDAPVG